MNSAITFNHGEIMDRPVSRNHSGNALDGSTNHAESLLRGWNSHNATVLRGSYNHNETVLRDEAVAAPGR
jgi:hypothetical protein